MVRKAIDSRIHTLAKNGVQQKHRSFFGLVGDRGRDQVGRGRVAADDIRLSANRCSLGRQSSLAAVANTGGSPAVGAMVL